LHRLKELGYNINYNQLNNFINQNFQAINSEKLIDALGYYYLNLNPNKNNNDQDIIKTIHSILSHPETISATSIRKYNLPSPKVRLLGIKTADASDSPFCSTAFKSTLGFFNDIGEIPIFNVIASGANAIVTASCDGSDNFSQEFAKINARLDEINNKLDGIDSNLRKFNEEWRQAKVKDYNAKLDTTINNISTTLDSYYYSLNNGKASKNVLEVFIKNAGGIENAKKNPLFNTNVELLANSSANIVNLYKNMLVSSNDVRNYLDAICSNSSSMPNEVIATRLWCSYRILEINSKLQFVSNSVENFFTDFNKVLPSYPKMAILTQATIDQNNRQIKDNFDPKAINYITNLLYGFNQTLLNNIKKIPDCKLKDKVNIDKWYDVGAASGQSPYITISCYGNSGAKDLITSKYYYQKQDKSIDTEVINVLGVLIPKNALSIGRETFQLLQCDNAKTIKKDPSTISGFYEVPKNVVINDTLDFTKTSLYPTLGKNITTRNSTNYDYWNFVTDKINPNSLNLKVMYPMAYYWAVAKAANGASNPIRTIMRTTYEQNGIAYGYIWANNIKLYRYINSTDEFFYSMSMECITNDCRIDNSNQTQLSIFLGSPIGNGDVQISFVGTQLHIINSKMPGSYYYINNKLYINNKQAF
jgi:hypothetical protein